MVESSRPDSTTPSASRSRELWPHPSRWERGPIIDQNTREDLRSAERSALIAAIDEMSGREIGETWAALILAKRLHATNIVVTDHVSGAFECAEEFMTVIDDLAASETTHSRPSVGTMSCDKWLDVAEVLVCHPHPLVRRASINPVLAAMRSSRPERAIELHALLLKDSVPSITDAQLEADGITDVQASLPPVDYFRYWRHYIQSTCATTPEFLSADIARYIAELARA